MILKIKKNLLRWEWKFYKFPHILVYESIWSRGKLFIYAHEIFDF